ncbi:MAG: hypothetical protein M3545_07005 [Acidobacteriota bacterium]|nr:hypothetical protein [Acidobacteriota bacterium]
MNISSVAGKMGRKVVEAFTVPSTEGYAPVAGKFVNWVLPAGCRAV